MGEIKRHRQILKYWKPFTSTIVALIICLVITRIYEWGLITLRHGPGILDPASIAAGLLNDLQFALIVSVPLGLIYLIARELNRVYTRRIMSGIIVILVLANALVITYYSVTLTPLGPDFWAYSIAEITDTIWASGMVTIVSLTILFLVGIATFWISRIIQKMKLPNFFHALYLLIPVAIIPLLITGGTVFPSAINDGYASQNKLFYFLESSFSNEFEKSLGIGRPADPISENYPLMHAAKREDVLGPYFDIPGEPPNIVFIIFESLGSDFVGEQAPWKGFTPYLDSLVGRSLFWENGLSLTGRTFGLMPSLFGSLPFGNQGFMELGPDYPAHQTLISLLDERGYHTAYFSGFNTYFDKLDLFLDYQGIDGKMNKEWIQNHAADSIKDPAHYWGYDDRTMLNVAWSVVDTTRTTPRLEIYHTLQSHSPFEVPDPDAYQRRFEQILEKLDLEDRQKERYRTYRSELTTLLFTDDAVRTFMNAYTNKTDYRRTIFIITGDHRLIPVPQPNQISRYHVPVIIYSPMLKRTARFRSVSTHADIVPSILAFLEHNYSISFPDSVHWLGTGMDTTRSFRNIHSIPLMRNKNQLIDYLDGEYYLADGGAFRLEPGMRLEPLTDQGRLKRLQNRLNRFKTVNSYVIRDDKIYPGNNNLELSGDYTFISQYDSLFNRIDSMQLTTNQQFQLARKQAFNNNYETARAICRRLLLGYPEFHDVRTLLGRTYSWNGQYEEAREQFYEVMRRDSTYYDTYNALFDTEVWAGNPGQALEIINLGLRFHPEYDEFLQKKIKALIVLNRIEPARQVLEKLRRLHPDNEDLPNLEKRVEEAEKYN